MMISKIKNSWVIFGYLFGFGLIIMLSDILFLSDKNLDFGDWFDVIFGIPFIFLIFFSLPTKKIIYSEDMVSVYWKIAVGKWMIYESNHYSLEWKNINRIYSIIPLWSGFHHIIIYGYRNGHGSPLMLGSQYTKKKEALIYIADHVRSEVIDDNIAKLIRKYRKRAEKKGLK